MITELFLDVVFSVIGGLLNLIPPMPDNVITQISGGMLGMVELFAKSSFIMPWASLISALTIWIAFHSVKLIKDTIDWVIAKIPFVG